MGNNSLKFNESIKHSFLYVDTNKGDLLIQLRLVISKPHLNQNYITIRVKIWIYKGGYN